jgi:hypothetical protein
MNKSNAISTGAGTMLTVSQVQAYRVSQFQPHAGTGFGDPTPEAHRSRAVQPRGFFVSVRNVLSWAGRMGDRNVCRSSGRFANLYGPLTRLATGKSGYTDRILRASTMATQPTMGAIRPVTRIALLARLRRLMAKSGETFHISRTPADIRRFGKWYCRFDNGDLSIHHIPDLEQFARAVGQLAEDEVLVGGDYE